MLDTLRLVCIGLSSITSRKIYQDKDHTEEKDETAFILFYSSSTTKQKNNIQLAQHLVWLQHLPHNDKFPTWAAFTWRQKHADCRKVNTLSHQSYMYMCAKTAMSWAFTHDNLWTLYELLFDYWSISSWHPFLLCCNFQCRSVTCQTLELTWHVLLGEMEHFKIHSEDSRTAC